MSRFLLSFMFFCLSIVSTYGQSIFPEKPINYVTDDVGILDYSQRVALNAKLKKLEDSSSNQVFVYITGSLQGNDLFSISQTIFNTWKIGQEGKDNGVLIAIFVDDKQFRIHTGYGLEGVLPDLTTKAIQDEFMRPEFKKQKYYEGINAGVDKIGAAIRGEYIVDGKHRIKKYTEGELVALIIFFVIFLTGAMLEIAMMNKKNPVFRKKLFMFFFSVFSAYVILMHLLCSTIYYPLFFTGMVFLAVQFTLCLPMYSFVNKDEDKEKSQKIYYWVISIFSGCAFLGVFLYVFASHLKTESLYLEVNKYGFFFYAISTIFSIILLIIIKGSTSYSSSGGYTFSSSGYYSSSSSSSSGFSGGGGGRSGGGGSSSSW